MAWTAPSTWVAGAILTAAQLNTQLRDNILCGGPIYATEALRDAAIPSPFEGQRAYITGPTIPAATGASTSVPTGVTTIYNGSVWVCTTPVAATTDTSGTNTSTSYTATLTSGGTNPSVTLVTGTTALVHLTSIIYNATTTAYSYVSVAVSGATTLAASDANAIQYSPVNTIAADQQMSRSILLTGLTAGTNTFTIQYKVSAGTGNHSRRTIVVQGIA